MSSCQTPFVALVPNIKAPVSARGYPQPERVQSISPTGKGPAHISNWKGGRSISPTGKGSGKKRGCGLHIKVAQRCPTRRRSPNAATAIVVYLHFTLASCGTCPTCSEQAFTADTCPTTHCSPFGTSGGGAHAAAKGDATSAKGGPIGCATSSILRNFQRTINEGVFIQIKSYGLPFGLPTTLHW